MTAGGILSAVVAGLFIFLNTAGKPEVPRVAEPLPPGHPIVVCTDAPKWVAKELPRAMAFWEKHGVAYGPTTTAVCPPACTFKGKLMACNVGAITITLRGQGFSENHADETSVYSPGGQEVWATIQLPEKIQMGEDMNAASLPKDAYALVLAHALGHAENYAHSRTPVSKGVYAEKTGELMNPNLAKMGWGDAGL